MLRLSHFFLLRPRLNCSNKQFYGKRKNAHSVGADECVQQGSKTSDTKLFWWTRKGGLGRVFLPRFHSQPPFCVHFTAIAVARPCQVRGLISGADPTHADFVKTLRACGRQGGTDGSYENYGRQQRHRAHCLRSVGNGSHLPHHPLVRHGRSHGSVGSQGYQEPARPDRECARNAVRSRRRWRCARHAFRRRPHLHLHGFPGSAAHDPQHVQNRR